LRLFFKIYSTSPQAILKILQYMRMCEADPFERLFSQKSDETRD
jgi:hypothetical protein